MHTLSRTEKLTPDKKEILKKFITTFLPQRGNKRKGSKNEIGYINTTLGRIFNQYFNMNITIKDILGAFEELQYSIFLKKGEWDSDHKEFKSSNKGTLIRLDKEYKNYDAAFIYIDIEPSVVGQLRLVTSGLPPHTNTERLKEKEDIIKRVYLFKQTIKENLNVS